MSPDCQDESGYPVASSPEPSGMDYAILDQAVRNTREIAWTTAKGWPVLKDGLGFGFMSFAGPHHIRAEYHRLLIESRMSQIAKQVTTASTEPAGGVSVTKLGRDANGRFRKR